MPWLKALLIKVFNLDQVVGSGKLRFIVIDGSTVQAPGAKGISYRLHIAIDLIKLELLQVTVTDDKQGESLSHYSLQNGDIVIIDRGYNQPKSLVPFIDNGGDVVLRYNPHSMNVYSQDEAMQKINWAEKLKQLNGQAGSFPVYVCHGNKRIEAIAHVTPLPPEQADQARRRTREAAKKRGNTPKSETLYLSGWVLVLTTVPEKILSADTIVALYRVRWQVELVIKRLKSLLNFDCLRAKQNSDLAQLYLHGKLLYAAVIEKIANRRLHWTSAGMIPERTHTQWRVWVLIASEVKTWLIISLPAQEQYNEEGLKALSERPRKRKLQTLPPQVFKLLDDCRTLGLTDC